MSNAGPAAEKSTWSRLVGPVLFAIAVGALIEVGIQLIYHPSFWQKTTWLVHDPYHGEPFDRVELYERLSSFEGTHPEIISVGDSSGFFSLQSTIVNRYTHGSYFLSLNTGANQAFLGYRSIAEYMLRRPNSRIKWVVLYLYPQLLPEEAVMGIGNPAAAAGDLSPFVYDTLVGPLSWLTPPSAFLSAYAKFKIFNGINWHYGPPLTNTVPTLQLHAEVWDAMGWLPEFDVRAGRINPQVAFYPDARTGILPRLGLAERSSDYAVFDDFNNMVKGHGAHLAIAFAPMSQRGMIPGDPYISEAEAALARFSHDRPDVKFLFPLITGWGPEKFGMFNHISREYTFLSSMRFGKALDQLVRDPDEFPAYAPHFKFEPLTPISATIQGQADRKMLESAFALYLYTQTLDEHYESLISRRVLGLLESDQAFRYMMDDARARANHLAAKKIKIGFDLSQMRARPIRVSGMSFCDQRPDTQWVQLDGVLNFTYRSPENAPAPEPVQWPEGSHIFIPLIKEDGILKFDGYCPEAASAFGSLADHAEGQ